MPLAKTSHKKKKQKKIPYHYKPDDLSYDEWQVALRRQYAQAQNFKINNIGEHAVYSDFELTNAETDKTYKVAIRSPDIGINFCSCPDFTINTLGTCKHIEYVLQKLRRKRGFKKYFLDPPVQEYSSLFLHYGTERKVILRIGSHKTKEFEELAQKYFQPVDPMGCNPSNGVSPVEPNLSHGVNSVGCTLSNGVTLHGSKGYWLLPEASFADFDQFMKKAVALDSEFRCYKDALDYIVSYRDAQQRRELISRHYPEGKDSPALDKLLKVKLYPYQKEAVLKMAAAGRSINADDMGLGKTIQAIATAEVMAQHLGVENVLIVCPTSLKYQWKREIEKFSRRSAFVIEGTPEVRKAQYARPEFFKIITYDVVNRDLEQITLLQPDLIILDEAQRIKNWKTKTAQSVKTLQSEYAIVLTGTPLENRLEELHSITEFVDRHKLGPLFRFLAAHQILEGQKVVGYKELHQISKTLDDILIRRTKQQVLKELPKRIDKNLFVAVTEEQKELHTEHYEQVSRLVSKWKRLKFLSEKERQMLMIHLNCMRMVADSTFILDQKTRFDTKIDEVMTLLKEIFAKGDDKVVIFSQWERMTRLVAQELEKNKIGFQYLHGGIPSKKRKDLLKNFHEDSHSRVFLSTDAGGVGLNLQCANYVINLDCPWNPAVLEQRIARVYRLGQTRSVEIINFISKDTIEESMLTTLKFKKSVFDGVLDNGKDAVFMGESKLKQFMNTVEKMTDAPASESKQAELQENVPVSSSTRTSKQVDAQKSKQTSAKQSEPVNDLFTTGISFLEKLSKVVADKPARESAMASFVEKDKKTGKTCLKIPVPNEEVVEQAVNVLSGFLEALKKGES